MLNWTNPKDSEHNYAVSATGGSFLIIIGSKPGLDDLYYELITRTKCGFSSRHRFNSPEQAIEAAEKAEKARMTRISG